MSRFMKLAAHRGSGGGHGAWQRRRRRRRRRSWCSACSATAPGATQTVGVVPVPRLPRLHRPGEQQGRRRGLQDPRARDRQRVQGAAGHGGARALQEGRRGAGRPLRHAADRGADQEAGGGQDPRHVARLRHGRGRRRQALPLRLPDRGQLLVAGGRRRSPSPRSSSAAASRARRSPTCIYDNPAGKEPLPILEDLAKSEGFELRTFAVPAPGVEMGAQVLDITGRFKPDFVITHLFGRAPSVSIKELKGKGYPAEQGGRLRVGRARKPTSRRPAATGVAEGYNTIQFAGVGTDFQVIKDINAMYKAQGKAAAARRWISVYYNRGVLIAARARRGGAQRHQGQGRRASRPARTSRRAWSRSRASPWAAWCRRWRSRRADHEGGGWVQVWTVKGGKLVKNGDWFQAYRDVIKKHLAATN